MLKWTEFSYHSFENSARLSVIMEIVFISCFLYDAFDNGIELFDTLCDVGHGEDEIFEVCDNPGKSVTIR